MKPSQISTIAELRERRAEARRSAKAVGFVPTMGALHQGHAKLIEKARQECHFVVVSIFVNPLQFGPNEDFNRYPRPLESDLELCERSGCDVVFHPAVAEMYPQEAATSVDVARIGDHLCGAFRPGHFRGVLTVVLKLFNIVAPDRAYFGEKDRQQLTLIRRMVADLNVPTVIIGVPTIREPDGLAMSSRNQYLTASQRRAAPALYRSLVKARDVASAGDVAAGAVRAAAMDVLRAEPEIQVQYFEVVDENMQPIPETRTIPNPAFAAAAVFLGSTRLIDNISLSL